MAQVLLHSVALDDPRIHKWHSGGHKLFTESAQNDQFAVHRLTHDPEECDLIIFTELYGHGMFAELVRRHPYVRKYREKTFLFDPGDYALPFLPGLYASLRKRYHNPERTRTGYYLREDENPYIDFRPLEKEPKYLGTFIGSCANHPVRLSLANLSAKGFLIEDTSSFAPQMLWGGEEGERHRFWSHYADGIAAGAFSLCAPDIVPCTWIQRAGHCLAARGASLDS